MNSNLGKIEIQQKTGTECLSFNNWETGLTLLDFWKWSVSDITSNATRGKLAEFIVASAIGIDLSNERNEWGAFDLLSPGPEQLKIEVKSAAYIQSWHQQDFSKICFSIKPSRYWDSLSNRFAETILRQADLYVFCLLKHKDKPTINPLVLDQWEFYVVPTRRINEKHPNSLSISLKSLQELAQAILYDKLGLAILETDSSLGFKI